MTSDFNSIKTPLDEGLTNMLICSVNNESVLMAIFNKQPNELDFAQVIEIDQDRSESTVKISGLCAEKTAKTNAETCRPHVMGYSCGKSEHILQKGESGTAYVRTVKQRVI
ncbi:hypothetical protein RF11_15432 [Thelohanellus kitauei]|uniref:Uncharacterized protein n=1 Tax=Thelohanellus kitauei TaxID=669202 RepID=A0A0C2MBQ5_THEKT|nr:hypothetical protein RF11_15432 [Thelohanellus kitauei]